MKDADITSGASWTTSSLKERSLCLPLAILPSESKILKTTGNLFQSLQTIAQLNSMHAFAAMRKHPTIL
jgi:hypothetical protein